MMLLCQYKIYSNGIILGVIKSSTPDNHRNDTRNALGINESRFGPVFYSYSTVCETVPKIQR